MSYDLNSVADARKGRSKNELLESFAESLSKAEFAISERDKLIAEMMARREKREAELQDILPKVAAMEAVVRAATEFVDMTQGFIVGKEPPSFERYQESLHKMRATVAAYRKIEKGQQ